MATKKLQKRPAKEKASAGVDRDARKAIAELRKALGTLVGEVVRVDEDTKKGLATAKEAKGVVTKLMKDPLVQVPHETKRQVEALEEKVKRLETKLAERALGSYVEKLNDDVLEAFNRLKATVDELGETVGDNADRIEDLEDDISALEDKATASIHADPPDHPAPNKPDPRQTTIDDHIEKAKAGGAEAYDPGDEDHDERAEAAGEMPS